ncbi:glycosyltransferase [Pedobacter sp. HMF7647]|uniref:Glycosyltransferase n=1 Tax=Hufsiella arboris TaxID=2695275 RepID=A0A7K1YB29_9SPHI|nr:glycosyltransferase family 1 protein [Hufsiella arboris]MXV51309.1 glycosyltransferase [Hufsiella arboris]
MEIFINGKYLTQPVSGVQRYAFELTKGLIAKGSNVKILVPNFFDIKSTEINDRFFVSTGDFKNTNLWEQVHLPLFFRKRKSSLLINLCNTGPVLIKNQIVCLHDIAFFKNPQWYSRAFYLYYKFLIPLIVRNSKHIVTVSEFSKDEITGRFRFAANKISVIYNAPAKIFTIPADKLILKKDDFFLFVGSFDPRKNLITLLKAFESDKLKKFKLIVVGKRSASFRDQKLIIPDNVTILDNCNDEDLSVLYKHASGLINCSIYEGFGLPLVEAMSSGCPLVLSDIPVFREIAGDRASYFDPISSDSIVHAIKSLADKKPEDLNSDIQHNHTLSSRFSWADSSTELFSLTYKLLPQADRHLNHPI